jgi:hypothetical protein
MGSIPSSEFTAVSDKVIKVADKYVDGTVKAVGVSGDAVALADKLADKLVIVIGVAVLCYTMVNLVPAYFPPPPRTKSSE